MQRRSPHGIAPAEEPGNAWAKSILLAGFAASLATGIATGVGALPLFLVRKLSAPLEDVFLAASAMLFIVSHEIIPETHRNGHQNEATLGFLGGLVVMMFVDVTLS